MNASTQAPSSWQFPLAQIPLPFARLSEPKRRIHVEDRAEARKTTGGGAHNAQDDAERTSMGDLRWSLLLWEERGRGG